MRTFTGRRMSLYKPIRNSSTAVYACPRADLGALAYIIQSSQPGARLVYSVHDSDKPGHGAYFATLVYIQRVRYVCLYLHSRPETDKLISHANTCGESPGTAAVRLRELALSDPALIFERFRISWLAYAPRIPVPGVSGLLCKVSDTTDTKAKAIRTAYKFLMERERKEGFRVISEGLLQTI